MEKHIIDRYTDDIKAQIWEGFGIDQTKLKDLGGFESFMYECEMNGEARILRVSHSDRYSSPQIHGELDFLRYLGENAANVAAPYLSPQGNLVEAFDDGQGGEYLVSLFQKALGGHMQGEWTDEFIQHYGETMGRLHRLTVDYEPSNAEWTRLKWNDPEILNYLDWLADFDAEAHAKSLKNIAYIKTLPKNDKNYGLIHQDAHSGNLFVHEGRITLFDFADACYAHFMHDIALVMFYALSGDVPDKVAYTAHFMPKFLEGYRREFEYDPKELANIPHFMRSREIDLFAIIQRDLPDWETMGDAWLTRMMDGRRENILAEQPFVDFDFSRLA